MGKGLMAALITFDMPSPFSRIQYQAAVLLVALI